MRWSFNAISLSFILLLVACDTETSADTSPVTSTNYTELVIAGEDAENGNYDPSLEYGPDGTGWMAYSAVNAGRQGSVQTRIARSTDNGKSWVRVRDVNTVTPVAAVLPDGEVISGNWWHEVASLVHDPDDVGREWKLFWHRFITRIPHRNDDDRMFGLGWIATRHAPSPMGPWSEEIALIGAGPFPVAPFKTELKIGDLHPEFGTYIILTEPGTFYRGGRLYLTLQAVRNPDVGRDKHDIIMISSADHGRSWQGIGVLLTAEEAAGFDASWFTGSSIAVEDGRIFLMVTPEVARAGFSAHRGTLVFEFENLDQGTLRRDADGVPVVVKRLYPHLSLGGQGDYDARNVNGGIVVPQFDMDNLPKAFRLFNTGEGIVTR